MAEGAQQAALSVPRWFVLGAVLNIGQPSLALADRAGYNGGSKGNERGDTVGMRLVDTAYDANFFRQGPVDPRRTNAAG